MQLTRRRTFAAATAAPTAPWAVRLRPAAGAALAALLACALLDPSPARAAGTISPGARLAATCTGCHGTNGATAGNTLPALAGQSREALLASLQAFKAGTRPATVMTQLAKGYTDEQLAQLAAFFAAQPAPRAAAATSPADAVNSSRLASTAVTTSDTTQGGRP
jgi:cytochrome c553